MLYTCTANSSLEVIMSFELKTMSELQNSSTDICDHRSPESMVEKLMRNDAFQNFFNTISNGGFLLFSAAVIAFVWSNIDSYGYSHFWHQEFSFDLAGKRLTYTLHHWVNDALMTIFFFTVGLEIKREMLVGGLSDLRKAALPVFAAIGGMVVPALFYVAFNLNGEGSGGWGIPMATDIAFSLAVLSLLGNRVPFTVRLFLTAFAIADDLGAILVIALFYTPSIDVTYLFYGGLIVAALAILNYSWIRYPLPYLVLGLGLWYVIAQSGLHATIAGVIVAMFIPATGRFNTDIFLRLVRERLEQIQCEGGDCGYTIMINRQHQRAVHSINIACTLVEPPLQRLEHAMSSWVAYLVLPLFALANAGVVLSGIEMPQAFFHPVALGVTLGLSFGKPLGIVLFTWMAVKFFRLPMIDEVNWMHILGIGFLGGIGFTMSLFISALSFSDPVLHEYAKIGIILGSVLASVFGLLCLKKASV